MTERKPLYFIAVVPPEPERSRLWELKRAFTEAYNTKAALRSPPHITLHMPFSFREDREIRLMEVLRGFVIQYPAFSLCLEGYGAFPPRVIYADVSESKELREIQTDLLQEMKTTFNIFNANYKDRPFRPHLTLAFRDLKKSMFHLAWEEYCEKSLDMCWHTQSVALLKHNGKMWEILEEMPLKSSGL